MLFREAVVEKALRIRKAEGAPDGAVSLQNLGLFIRNMCPQ